jgi:uncharacterized membrane protein YcaP (DUF421 family)
MVQPAWDALQRSLGLDLDVADVGAAQMALRTVVVYALTLVIVRLGSKRFLSKGTAFDVIVGIMLGSVMSSAINGSAPFFPTVVAGAMLVGMHWLLAVLAYRISWFGSLVKGNPVDLVRDGKVAEKGMRRGSVSRLDLTQALRAQTKQTDPAKIERAVLERDGSISVIPSKQDPRVLAVSVEDGVQTVRIVVG